MMADCCRTMGAVNISRVFVTIMFLARVIILASSRVGVHARCTDIKSYIYSWSHGESHFGRS